jgi:hypothetical protein
LVSSVGDNPETATEEALLNGIRTSCGEVSRTAGPLPSPLKRTSALPPIRRPLRTTSRRVGRGPADDRFLQARQASSRRWLRQLPVVQSGHEVTREAGYRSPRNAASRPCVWRERESGRAGGPGPCVPPSVRGEAMPMPEAFTGPCGCPVCHPSLASITERLTGHPFARRHEVPLGVPVTERSLPAAGR